MDELDLRIVESICCVRCGAQCEEEQAGDLLVFTCPEDHTRHLLTVKAPTEVAVEAGEDPLIGRTLGPCRVVRRAGTEGGLPLYHGLHTALNQPYTVRVIAGEAAQDRERLQAFVRRARFAAAVRHGAIANATHLGELDGGGLFAVLAPLEGEPFDRALGAAGRLGVRETIRVGRLLAEALATLHVKKIVHRNVGPKSVFLLPTGQPQLRNFAFAVGPDQPAEELTVVGQPGYLAPEQATGGSIGPRADIYALGALLYHALAGRPPYSGSDAADIVRNQVAGKAPDLDALAGPPPGMADLILAMLAHDPAERPADARAVLDALMTVEAQLSAQEAQAVEAAKPVVPEGAELVSLALDEGHLSIAEPGPAPAEPAEPPEPELAKDEEAPPPTISHPAVEPALAAEPAPADPLSEPQLQEPSPEPSFTSALEFGPRPAREGEAPAPEAEAPGPRPSAAPRPAPAPARPQGMGELGFAEGEEEELQEEAIAEVEVEVVESFWEKNKRLAVLGGAAGLLLVAFIAHRLLFSKRPSPRPKADKKVEQPEKGKPAPKAGTETSAKPDGPTAAEKLEQAAKAELPRLEHFARTNPTRLEEILKRCDEFLKEYGKTSSRQAAEDIRKKALERMLEDEAKKDLHAIRTLLGDRGKSFATRLEGVNAYLAKYKGTKSAEEALKMRDQFAERAEREAEGAIQRDKGRIDRALEETKYGEALEALGKLVGEHEGTKAGNAARAQLDDLTQRVNRMFQDKKTAADMLVQRWSFDEAAALFEEPIKVWQVPAMKEEAEGTVATLAERRLAVVAGYGQFLADHGKLVVACDFDRAATAAQAAAGAAKDPVLRALLEAKAREAQRLSGLLGRVVAGAQAQQAEAAKSDDSRIWIQKANGSRFRGTLDKPDREGLFIDIPGTKGRVTWGELSREQLVTFALSAPQKPSASDHVALGLLALSGDDVKTACEQFTQALDADPTSGDAIQAALQRPGLTFVHIPGGEFLAGPNKTQEELRGFLLCRYEVTNAEYALFLRATGGQPPPEWRGGKYLRGHDHYPVSNVTLEEARACAAWRGMRLPTAREWEKACRGTDGRLYPWGDEFDRRRANLTYSKLPAGKERRPRLVPVDRAVVRDDVPFPLYHIVGNVREWTSTPASAAQNETRCLVVGGSAADTERDALPTTRKEQQGVERDPFTGFRLAWPR